MQCCDRQTDREVQVPLPTTEEAATFKVAIAHTCWHSELVMMMVPTALGPTYNLGSALGPNPNGLSTRP